MQNGQPFTKLEARACMALKSIMFCKSQIARLAAYQTLQGTPTCDWLLEQGLITVRLSNPTTQFSKGEGMPYVTPTGRAWFFSTPGPGVAILVLCTSK